MVRGHRMSTVNEVPWGRKYYDERIFQWKRLQYSVQIIRTGTAAMCKLFGEINNKSRSRRH